MTVASFAGFEASVFDESLQPDICESVSCNKSADAIQKNERLSIRRFLVVACFALANEVNNFARM